ncbi:MAG TPA: aminotransferase class I/II-fold pyridoxal phosphate-dependent enzyme [Galbitalea sp.]|jgi:dTDP-4-amino-4,6-dideoxygalactose transaminase|nr:aminotransferase class I/II-fold pyridoxal phosphate-dependent enzyme [Galbitalea sp.]
MGTGPGPADERSLAWEALPAFENPLHVGRPNIGDRAMFDSMVDQMFERRWLSNDGPLVQEFEARIAEFIGVKHCIAMNNGTLALEIAIRALGLTGEVIVPSYSFVATAHALDWLGITPVFADIDPATHNLDTASVRAAITPKTSGIIGVHLWGRPAPAKELQEIADEHGLQLMFDAAHAFGCTLDGQRIGGFGRAEVFSFHATKFFNTFEGGAVVTNDDDVADQARHMRNFGFEGPDNVTTRGTNGKLTEICAAMGLTNLASVDEVIAVNHRNYLAYQSALAGIAGIHLTQFDESETGNFQYITIEVDDECLASRDDIVAGLTSKNVLARKYFWPGIHRMQPYREQDPDAGSRLPNTERIARRVIVLPTGTSVNENDIELIAAMIRTLSGGHAS